jgi:hypothetical protein
MYEYHLLFEIDDIQKNRGRKNEHRSKVKNTVHHSGERHAISKKRNVRGRKSRESQRSTDL